jgi:hypothetical protein
MARRIHRARAGHWGSNGASTRASTLGGGASGERGALAVNI